MKIVYLDASTALRWILKAPHHLSNFGDWKTAGSSVLFETECVRTLERLRDENSISTEKYIDGIGQVQELWDSMEKIPVTTEILFAAKQRFIAPIKTLDAIHAVSAQLWSRALDKDVMLISHDKKLNLIAKSLGLKTLESK